MIFVCFGVLMISLILALYANSLNKGKTQRICKFVAYGLVIFDILMAFFC